MREVRQVLRLVRELQGFSIESSRRRSDSSWVLAPYSTLFMVCKPTILYRQPLESSICMS
jgi:hypothetical protein